MESTDPLRVAIARTLGLVMAWTILTPLAICLFIQGLYQSQGSAIVFGVVLLALLVGPAWSMKRRRALISDPPITENTDISRDLAHR